MNKSVFISLIGILLCTLSYGQEKTFIYTGNPLVRDIYTADPSAHVWKDGRLYVYPSQDIYPSRGCDLMDKYHVYSTDDMINWIDHGQILEAKEVPWGEPLADNATFMWAPDCAYKNGKYYFYFPHPNKDPWGDNWKTGIAVSDKPASDFVSLDYWMKGLPDYGYIDPCVFVDNDGQAYFYYGGSQKCFGAKLKDSMDEIDGELLEMKGLPSFHEGAWVFRRGDIYYLMYPAGIGSKDGDELRYATSDNPLGPWTHKGQVLKPTGCGTSHGSIVEFKGQWYLFYHNQTLSDNGTLRSICFDKLYFNEDGSIQTVNQTQDTGAPYKNHTFPGTIEAEDYNKGGQPYAYWDNTSTNEGGKYRLNEGVDIKEDRRSQRIYVGNTTDKEYLNYTFEVTEDGIYEIDFLIASASSGESVGFYLEFDQQKTSNPKIYTANYAPIAELPTVTVSEIPLSKGTHVMTFRPQGNLNFDKFIVRNATGLNVPESETFRVYPNPSNGIYQIETEAKALITVTSLNGSLILQEETQGTKHTIDISDKPTGIYILSVKINNQSFQKKLIKKFI